MATDEHTYWYDVLHHFESNGYIHNGLTIPFLIAARRIVEPGEPLLTIEDLIMEVDAVNAITIMKCDDIGEYVIGCLDSETAAIINSSKYCYSELGNVTIIDSSLEQIKSVDQLIEHLEGIYSNHINEGKYSVNGGIWGDFSDIEKRRLKEVIFVSP